eukprot:TRINITY_DN182_c0_g1_i2.p1 TRINITY_DN182_c0_g1~~TRINITY_DN182_c0_g1_i2.p1  ORF type:complete len:226 (+),score=-11.11 TRINITY_DN182_c0_g1_i2:86-763(+)
MKINTSNCYQNCVIETARKNARRLLTHLFCPVSITPFGGFRMETFIINYISHIVHSSNLFDCFGSSVVLTRREIPSLLFLFFFLAHGVLDGVQDLVQFGLRINISISTVFGMDELPIYTHFEFASNTFCSDTVDGDAFGKRFDNRLLEVVIFRMITSATAEDHFNFHIGRFLFLRHFVHFCFALGEERESFFLLACFCSLLLCFRGGERIFFFACLLLCFPFALL